MSDPIEATMTTYRLFWINDAGRIASSPEMVEAPDDHGALRQAEGRAKGRTFELWDRSRRISVRAEAACR